MVPHCAEMAAAVVTQRNMRGRCIVGIARTAMDVSGDVSGISVGEMREEVENLYTVCCAVCNSALLITVVKGAEMYVL